MTQPLDRGANIPQIGDLDTETGEFWREHTFEMGRGEDNLSAYEANRMFLNLDGKQFLDCSFGSGCDIDADSRSVVAADFNRDGGTDLLVGSVGGGALRLFANQRLDKSHSVRVNLQGTESNRQGVGSRVVATVDGKRIIRDLFPTNGCLGQGPSELLVGVGSATQIDRLEIRWPNGETQSLGEIPVDGIVTITEGSGEFQFTSYSDAQASPGKAPAKQSLVAIDQPKFISATESKLTGDERVLGIAQGTWSRTYPIRYMQAHQLCHDEVGGQPILISYCTPAGAGTAFLRSLKNGDEQLMLKFAVAGMIESVGYTVIRDDQTKSLWNPITGECIAGILKGTKMKRVSMATTTWQHWKRLCPQTKVLAAVRSTYADAVFDSSNSGSKYASDVSGSSDPDAFGLGVRGATQQLFVPLDSLGKFSGSFIAGKLDRQPIIVVFDTANASARCFYSRISDGEALKFSQSKSSQGRYVADDGSEFDFLGRCQSGPLQGKRLVSVADSTITRWFAWNKTFPKSFVVKKKSN